MTRDLNVRVTALLPKRPTMTLKLIGTDTVSGGVGGWEEVARRLREPVLVWTKQPLLTYTLPLRFNRFQEDWDYTVEGEIRGLMDWASAGRRRTGEHNPPTLVRLSGNVRVPASTNWAITGLEWGEYITNADGDRVQADVTMTLTESVPVSAEGYAEALREALGENTDA